jgi:O-antigen/teichoic acid export membrane protein
VKVIRNDRDSELPHPSEIDLGARSNLMLSLHWDALARVLSILLTTVTILALARSLGQIGFAKFQISLTVAGYILWVGDFGLLTRITNLSGSGRDEELKKSWNMRITNTSIVMLIYFVFATFHSRGVVPLVGIALVVDGFVDANYNLRMLTRKRSAVLFFQPIRKALQSMFLVFVLLTQIKLTENVIFLVFFLPSFCLLIWDIKTFGGTHWKFDFAYLKTTFGYFSQGGSTYLANCDYLILAHSGHSELITLVALPRRIVNSISLLGTITNPRIQNDVAKSRKISRFHRRTIVLTTLIGFTFSILFSIGIGELSEFFLGFSLTSTNLMLVTSVLLSTPIQMLVVAINSLYFGLEAPRYPVTASYIGSVSYIVFLGIAVIFDFPLAATLGMLIILRLIAELIYLLVKLPILNRKMI